MWSVCIVVYVCVVVYVYCVCCVVVGVYDNSVQLLVLCTCDPHLLTCISAHTHHHTHAINCALPYAHMTMCTCTITQHHTQHHTHTHNTTHHTTHKHTTHNTIHKHTHTQSCSAVGDKQDDLAEPRDCLWSKPSSSSRHK